MKKTTKLRFVGACILFFNLWLIGQYNITGAPVLLITFGFAAVYEYLVVSPTLEKTDKTEKRKCFMIAAFVWIGVHFGLNILFATTGLNVPYALFALIVTTSAIAAYYIAKNQYMNGRPKRKYINTRDV